MNSVICSISLNFSNHKCQLYCFIHANNYKNDFVDSSQAIPLSVDIAMYSYSVAEMIAEMIV